MRHQEKSLVFTTGILLFFKFLSFAITWHGRFWLTSEHAYQAAKFMDKNPEIAEEIRNALSAHDAKKLVEKYREKIDPDFEKTKVELMEEICAHKLNQHPYIKKKLLETGDKEIVEDSPKDDFWGWGPDRDGRNELGKVWMRLREKTRKS